MIGMFMAAVESSIVAPAVPTIVAKLGGFQLYTWMFASYLVAQAVAIPIWGRFADVHGRKRVFCVSAGIFLLGSMLCGFSQSMEVLIGFRILQGLGAGAIVPIGSTIIADIYSPADRARLQGYLSSVWGFAAIVGPLLGAFIVQYFSWPLIFWINLPVGVLAIALLVLFFRESPRAEHRRIDYGGAALLLLGSGVLMVALVQAKDLGATLFLTLLAVAAVGIGVFIRHELRAEEPMLRLDLWKNRVIAVGNVGSTVIGAIMMGITAFLPAYVLGAMGRDLATAGFTLTAMSVGWSSASALGGQVMLRTSYRTVALLGALSLLLGNGMLMLLHPSSGPVFAGAGALLVGMGMGFCSTTFIVSIQSAVVRADRGTATSAMLFMRFVGQSIGVALFGGVFNYALFGDGTVDPDAVNRLMDPALRPTLDPGTIADLTGKIDPALHTVYMIALALAFVALAIMAALPRRHSPHAERDH